MVIALNLMVRAGELVCWAVLEFILRIEVEVSLQKKKNRERGGGKMSLVGD